MTFVGFGKQFLPHSLSSSGILSAPVLEFSTVPLCLFHSFFYFFSLCFSLGVLNWPIFCFTNSLFCFQWLLIEFSIQSLYFSVINWNLIFFYKFQILMKTSVALSIFITISIMFESEFHKFNIWVKYISLSIVLTYFSYSLVIGHIFWHAW